MSAIMARQGSRVQLEQSDMRLALNMAKMAKRGFSCTARQEAHFLNKEPCAEVREEKMRGVEFHGYMEVQAAMESDRATLRENQSDCCLPC